MRKRHSPASTRLHQLPPKKRTMTTLPLASKCDWTSIDRYVLLRILDFLEAHDRLFYSAKVCMSWFRLVQRTIRHFNLNDLQEWEIAQVATMVSLHRLSLCRSAISDVAQISSLTSLQQLSITYSLLKTTTSLSRMQNLRQLDVRATSISSLETLQYCKHLEIIDATSSTLRTLAGLEKCPSLHTLRASATFITRLGHLDRCRRLQVLEIRNTCVQVAVLARTVMVFLAGCSRLRLLSVPIGSQLRVVQLCHSSVRILDPLGRCSQLQTMFFGAYKSGSLGSLQLASTLRVLDLHGSKDLRNIEPLQNLTALNYVDLSGTRINNIMPLANSIGSIIQLCLGDTLIRDISILSKARRLNNLNLQHSDICDLEPLVSCPNLKYLNLSHNIGIQNADLRPLNRCISLNSLNLSDASHITSLEALGEGRALKRLYLNNLKITTISSVHLLDNVTTMFLSGSKLVSMSELPELQQLQTLDLSYSIVKNVDALSMCKSLKNLRLRMSSVVEVDALGQCQNLQVLDLSGCKVEYIDALAESKTLGALDISSTTVKSVVELRNAVSLQELNVFDTHLCSIDVLALNRYRPTLLIKGFNRTCECNWSLQ